MKVLVTGGTGVVGAGTVTELLSRGHEVVLLSRHAGDDVRQWAHRVTASPGDVTVPASIRGAADGCDVVLHMVGIVEESEEASFDTINVQGTANMLAEAKRAGVRRFVYVSSLGAPSGKSHYHRSKTSAEALTRSFPGEWFIVRPGNVYGPGDGQLSMLLRLVRGPIPVVPRVGDGDRPLQPIWWEDCAKALATVVDRAELVLRELDIAGPDITTQTDLIHRFGIVVGHEVHAITIPYFLATVGAKLISSIGWDISLSDDQVTMLHEGNVVPEGGTNALSEILGIEPTPLHVGLRRLAELQPEQLPSEGIGSLKRKRYWADINDCQFSAESLFETFRQSFNEMTPVFVGATGAHADDEIREGESLTLTLPMRGHVQVRAVEVDDRHVTFITLEGHPLAGAVRFACETHGEVVRFQAEVFDRAANIIDLLAMRTLGDRLQDHTWTQLVEQMIERSGGHSLDGVRHESSTLSEHEARDVENWLEDITVRFKRDQNEARVNA